MTEVENKTESFTNNRVPIPPALCPPDTSIRLREDALLSLPMNPSTSTTAESLPSILSDDVNRWISGDTSAINTSVQASRINTAARSTLTLSSSLLNNGLLYTLAMILPLMGCGGDERFAWRCTPSFVFTTGELLFTRLASFCVRTRDHFSSLAQDHVLRQIFAVALDIVLLIYAIGFLILSMCQAAVYDN